MRDSTLCLGGLPALQRCRLAFHIDGDSSRTLVHISESSFNSQRNSLQELSLRGVSNNIRLANLGWYLIGLPALRCLAIHLGVTNLKWLETTWRSEPAGPVHSLNLDDNAALQLNGESAAALLKMTGLKKLSMRKSVANYDGSGIAGQAGSAASGAVWSAASVRCLTRLAAARPTLELCF